eukprot:Opistho-2@59502
MSTPVARAPSVAVQGGEADAVIVRAAESLSAQLDTLQSLIDGIHEKTLMSLKAPYSIEHANADYTQLAAAVRSIAELTSSSGLAAFPLLPPPDNNNSSSNNNNNNNDNNDNTNNSGDGGTATAFDAAALLMRDCARTDDEERARAFRNAASAKSAAQRV